RHPVFASPGGPDQAALCAYLSEHYSPRERSTLHESIALLPHDLPRVARLVSSVEWLEEFLGREASEPARRMVRFFMERRERVALRDLEEYLAPLSSEELSAALAIAVRRAVLFIGLRRDDLEPLVGIWPSAARRLHRLAVALAPEPVEAARAFCHPYLVEDMTSVLLAARVEPIRVRRGDERPFSKFIEETSARLLSFPGWLEQFTAMTLEARVELALRGLRVAGLLVPASSLHGALTLRARTGSGDWTGAPLGERLRLFVDALSRGGGGPDGIFDLLDDGTGPGEEEQPEGMLRTVLQAFTSVPTASFIRFSDFAEYQAAIGGPSGIGARESGSAGDRRTDSLPVVSTDEALEELWKFVLHRVLGRGILALGGAEAGMTGDGRPCFRLTETGRRLLARSPLPAGEARPVTDIVVQPTFEIIFLSPSPAAEAALARFCERMGREVGLLFRMTKQSIQRAGASGLGEEEVLGALARFSRSPVPPNVAHEVSAWLAPDPFAPATPLGRLQEPSAR
ncbi:MAG: helicase-associated domain-containing protein, partial [Spirochaetes bacterium]|nr:helicase-associated domain-containing protein [Spirochaetota bacterium]